MAKKAKLFCNDRRHTKKQLAGNPVALKAKSAMQSKAAAAPKAKARVIGAKREQKFTVPDETIEEIAFARGVPLNGTPADKLAAFRAFLKEVIERAAVEGAKARAIATAAATSEDAAKKLHKVED